MTTTIPDSFYCPIGMTLMEDPWMCPEGYSFDKKNIFTALDIKQESPITRNYLTKDMMKPNRSLKDSIDSIRNTVTLELLRRDINIQSQSTNSLTKNLPQDFQLSIKTTYFDNKVHIKVTPSNTNKRQSKHVVLVVDVSGSMGTDAQSENETERDGLSVLDLVKQAIVTIVMNLTQDDILSIISYSEKATVVCELIKMDQSGKDEVKEKLKELKPYGRTNIWDGLKVGIDTVMKAKSLVGGSGIFLLTDGLPNVNPIRPIEVMLQNKIDASSGLCCNFNTFGFGNSLDSELLNKLAQDGSFSYINDSSMLGTNFVNALANFLANITNIQLKVEIGEERKLKSIPGYSHKNLSWGSIIDIGQIQYGDSRDVILILEPQQNSDSEDIPSITVACETHNQEIQSEINSCISSEISLASPANRVELLNQYYRLETCDSVEKAKNFMLVGQHDEAKDEIQNLISSIESNMDSDSNPFITGLLQDLSAQISQAVSNHNWFTKWGCHFLSAIKKAHLYQMCMDFKNPGIQIYGGELFAQIRLDGEEIFCNLPPPEPSNKDNYDNNYRGGGGRRYVASSSQSITQSYYNSSGVCYHGDCLVHMFQYPKKKVKEVVKGDIVVTPYGPSKVVCVVKTLLNPRVATKMVRLDGGLVITPHHPVLMNSTWEFPCNIKTPSDMFLDAVYSFALDSGDVISVNGINTACLGHSFNQNDVIKHAYFGSQRVIQDLRKLEGWSNGKVNITNRMVHRDPESNQIVSIS